MSKGNKREIIYEDYESYVSFDYYDDEYREKMILQFKNEGDPFSKGFQFWIKKELEESSETRKNEAENFKKVVDVKCTDESSLALQQQHYSSSREAKSWSSDSPPLIKPLAFRLPSRSHNPPVPLLISWGNHSTKKRIAGSTSYCNVVHHERPNRFQKMIRIMNIEEEQNQQKDKKKKELKGLERKKKNKNKLVPPQDMPNELLQAITKLGGTDPVWLAQKELTESDVKKHLSRYFIPSHGVATLLKFMTVEENNKLKQGGLPVMVVDTSGKRFQLDFRFWISLGQYVLTGVNYDGMVKSLGLQPELDSLQLWGFRLSAEKDLKLCFATNIIRGPRNI